MTNITVYGTGDTYTGIRIEGHAGYADAGEDIVCAGISVLAINFINSVETFTDDKFVVHADENDGVIDFRFTSIFSEKSQLLMKSLVLGLSDLQKENKDFISLDYKEV
ncbi:MAG: ribosomal-processing cysteine protease Prp [Eubacterium sp.]